MPVCSTIQLGLTDFPGHDSGAIDMMATRILRHTAFLLCLSVVFVSTSLQAGRPARSPGIYIPPLKTSQADELTATRWVASGKGGHMQVSAPADEAWAALEQALAGFGVKPLERHVAAREWLTDWVVWKYNSKTGTGQSKPGLSIAGSTLERHQFRFAVQAGDAANTAIIMVTDQTRQEEVDIAPDSTYAWLEWQAHQTMLINEKHLSLVDPEARKYLQQEMDKFFAGEDYDKAEGYVPPAE